MSGFFRKAPLSYVAARVSTSENPPFTEEQYVSLRQKMIECDLVNYEVSTAKDIKINANGNDQPTVTTTTANRKCFLNKDRTSAFVVDVDFIEWRSTDYKNYKSFFDGMMTVFNSFISIASSLENLDIRQTSLSYVDIIVPPSGDDVLMFFNDAVTLPLNVLPEAESMVQLGSINFTRIIENRLKIDISIEQLPQRAKKLVPEMFMEPDPAFGMPINLVHDLNHESDDPYVLLTTQASMLVEKKMRELNSDIGFDRLHELTKEVFNSLINKEYCDKVWEYSDGQED